MGLNVAFWILAVTAFAGALAVVTMRSVFRAALGLILCFLAVAGLFFTLSADFLGAVQVLIYVGAIAVLVILAIMFTHEAECGNLSGKFKLPALLVATLFLGLAGWAMLATHWPASSAEGQLPTTAALGSLLFGQDGILLAVEIAALLLLAAIIGAIAIAREK